MKPTLAIILTGMALFLTGCATTTQVDDMINAAHKDFITASNAQQASIDELTKSSSIAQEKIQILADAIAAQKTEMEKALHELKKIRSFSDVAKTLSAENTVKVSNLEESLQETKESTDKAVDRLDEADRLFIETLTKHCQAMTENANTVLEALKVNDMASSTSEPVPLDKPIEIVAPDTSAITTNTATESVEL